jgi:polysaccharide export outer membrane protein
MGTTNMNVFSSLLLSALLVPGAAAAAQQPPPVPIPTPLYRPDFQPPATEKPALLQPLPNAPASARYTLGPNDQLKITVLDEEGLSGLYRVTADGSVTMPLVGSVPAAGLTLADFQEKLRTMLSAGYLRNPQVRVEIEQFKSQSVFVIGEVRAPGEIPMTGTMTLLKALALAGSPTASASSEVLVAHPRKPTAAGMMPAETDADIVHINLKDLQLGRAGQDVVLLDGDIINVPKAQTFYITGQIRTSGSFVWDPGMTVQQAIALAGGLADRGSSRGIVAERMVNGKLKEVKVELTDKVQPNDTLKVRQRFF